jgi:hypothetical protein
VLEVVIERSQCNAVKTLINVMFFSPQQERGGLFLIFNVPRLVFGAETSCRELATLYTIEEAAIGSWQSD